MKHNYRKLMSNTVSFDNERNKATHDEKHLMIIHHNRTIHGFPPIRENGATTE